MIVAKFEASFPIDNCVAASVKKTYMVSILACPLLNVRAFFEHL